MKLFLEFQIHFRIVYNLCIVNDTNIKFEQIQFY